MFEENWGDMSQYRIECAIRNKALFGMYYWIDVEQYAGRFYNLPKRPGFGSCKDIGITYNDLITAMSEDQPSR